MEDTSRNDMDTLDETAIAGSDSLPETNSNKSVRQLLPSIQDRNHIVNAETIRHNLFLQAGITDERLAELVRDAVDANAEMLKAFKWMDGTKQPDNNARNRAIENIYELTGVKAPKVSSNRSQKVTLHLSDVQPNWFKEVKDEVPQGNDERPGDDGKPDGNVGEVGSEDEPQLEGDGLHASDGPSGECDSRGCRVDNSEGEDSGVRQ